MFENENNEFNEYEQTPANEYTSVSHYCNEEPDEVTTELVHLETQPERIKQDNTKKYIALAVVLCIILSAVCGAGGAYIVNKLMKNEPEIQLQNNEDTSAPSTEVYVSEESMNTVQVASAASPSVVEISTESISTSIFMQQYVTDGAGSGVILSEDGYIVTNYHVIEGVSRVSVKTHGGESYEASFVGADESNDLAVIKIEATGLNPVEFGDSDSLVVGQKAIAIGNPLGSLGGTVTEGIISALDREISINGQTMNLLQTSAAINPGNSGGGLFDENAKLVGIINAKSSGSEIEGLGFAIPSNTVKNITDELIENGSVSGNSSGIKLGITVIEISDKQTASMYRVDRMGVYIVNVELNSNASNAGLQAGDCIVAIDGKEIEKADDISAILKQYSAGETITITYSRNGVENTVQTFLAASNG